MEAWVRACIMHITGSKPPMEMVLLEMVSLEPVRLLSEGQCRRSLTGSIWISGAVRTGLK